MSSGRGLPGQDSRGLRREGGRRREEEEDNNKGRIIH